MSTHEPRRRTFDCGTQSNGYIVPSRCSRSSFRVVAGCALVFTVSLAADPNAQRPARSDVLSDTVLATVDLVIGEGLRSAYSFGEVSGLAAYAKHKILVSDAKDAKVIVFDSSGEVVTQIGRSGDGPGEFRWPTGVAASPDGSMYVRDVRRVSRFTPDPSTGIPSVFDRVFTGPVFPDWRSKRPTRFDAAGNLFYPHQVRRADEPRRIGWIKYSPLGVALDTLLAPPYPNIPSGGAWVRTSAHGGRMVPGLDVVPFSSRPVWELGRNGNILAGSGEDYTISELDPSGHVVRLWHRTVKPIPVDAAEWRDSLRALNNRIDSLPVPVARLEGSSPAVVSRTLPKVYPPYTAVIAAADGAVWIRRWPRARHNESIFDRFNATGDYSYTIILPLAVALEPPPVVSDEFVIGVVVDRETDLPRIARFRFRSR